MSKPKDPHRFVDVCPRKDHRGKDLVSEEFKEKNTMRINLPLGDFHEGDECEFFSLVDSKWYSDGIIMVRPAGDANSFVSMYCGPSNS